MTTSDLTGTEMIVLLVLMAEARGLTNAEIKERGPELRATPSRKKLNELGLIESDTSARPHRHALSDRGWAQCYELLGTNPPAGTTPQGKALFTVLAGLGRHLHSNDLRLADVFSPPPDPVAPAETTEPLADDTTRIDPAVDVRIIEAYRSLAVKPGAWVALTEIRGRLTDVSRGRVDAALVSLYSRPGFRLIPEENRKALTSAARDAAVSIGNQDKHLISMESA